MLCPKALVEGYLSYIGHKTNEKRSGPADYCKSMARAESDMKSTHTCSFLRMIAPRIENIPLSNSIFTIPTGSLVRNRPGSKCISLAVRNAVPVPRFARSSRLVPFRNGAHFLSFADRMCSSCHSYKCISPYVTDIPRK